jgi:omega-6 fatty acid desaturase (delta-12 desaturase)
LLSKATTQEQVAFEVLTTEAALGPELARRFKAYGADSKVAIRQLITTAIPFAALLVAMEALSHAYYWLTLLLAVPTAGLLIRLFIIQHDCGHGSFFPSRSANDLLGRVLSVLTLTPYTSWARGHAAHHASAGNLDRRGRGDVDTWTVSEYLAASSAKKLLYRLLRNPFFLVGIGAPLNFIVLQRVPRGGTFRDSVSRRSVLFLNIALLVVLSVAISAFGALPVLGTYLPVIIVASWIGNWLFFVQHQFEGTYWERGSDWNFHEAALKGSSHFKLPPILQWFSGSIGLHHVHHLSSRVPNYHLQTCLDAAPELDRIAAVITLRQSLGCWRLALWHEQRGTLVSFRDLKQALSGEDRGVADARTCGVRGQPGANR